MKYTIKEIAALCGVGKSTVSRVLNHDPKVRPETRQKIQRLINELGFEPNRSARAMRGISDPVVGIIMTRLNSPSESQTLSAILSSLYQQGITPIIVESQFSSEKVQHHLKVFKQRSVNGVILFGFSSLDDRVIQEWHHNVVVIARKYKNISSVFYDDENAIRTLMTYFYQQNYRHIAYLGVVDSDETTGRLRTQSYLAFCQQYGLETNLVLGDLSIEESYTNCEKLFNQPVDAIVCASSRLAVGALKFLQEKGEYRPLACIGNNEVLQHLAPHLISLDFGYQQAGKWAVELLVSQLQGNTQMEQRCVPFQLIR